MAPDLDIFIRSASDPLLAVEYHRHFTHALLFIPIGGLLCALPFLLFPRMREQWRAVLGAATLAVATHGLLDACTSYGTQLLWPFSNYRVVWSWISIIDPIFTLTLLTGVIWAAFARRRRQAAIALLLCISYISFGAVQKSRALEAQVAVAAQRGHSIDRGEVFPTIGNNLVWRSLYQFGDQLHADRIRVNWTGKVQWTSGTSVMHVSPADLAAAELDQPRVVADFARFYWFSGGWVARSFASEEIYGDVRYSLRTDAFDPIWGVRFDLNSDSPTQWVSRSAERELGLSDLWREINGSHPDYQLLTKLGVGM